MGYKSTNTAAELLHGLIGVIENLGEFSKKSIKQIHEAMHEQFTLQEACILAPTSATPTATVLLVRTT